MLRTMQIQEEESTGRETTIQAKIKDLGEKFVEQSAKADQFEAHGAELEKVLDGLEGK